MRAKLELVVLGSPQVRLLGKPVTGFKTHKAQALLYYLAVTGHAYTRSSLAGLLWGDLSESSAHVNLSKALSELRALVGEFVNIERDRVSFNRESEHWLDLYDLEKAKERVLKQSTRGQGDFLEEFGVSKELYRGDFLEGFYVRDAPEFEVWMLTEREQRRSHLIQMLDRLVDLCLLQGHWHIGLDYARHLLAIEPWRETAHRQMMLLFAQSGQRTSALAQYQTCRQVLSEELGVEPDPITTNLYELIRTGELKGHFPITVQDAAGRHPEDNGIAIQTMPLPARQSLPQYPTPFVGREQEIAAILLNLQEPNCRLLNLVGPGGIGKTRLALEVTKRLLDNPFTQDTFAHGVFFVSLQPVTTEHAIISAIAASTGYQFFGKLPAREQVLNHLRQKQILLVLDNFEHLLDHTDLIVEILESVPEVKILLTSRVALNVRQEWFHPISGLRFSGELSAGQEAVSEYDAVRLLVQSARRVQPNFSLNAEQEHVLHICRLVGGMPLGIEMASAWLRAFSCKEIAAEIEKDLSILTARYQDVPERHRSIRVLMEQSWQMLADAEQEVLMRLAVFPGGFTYGAAQQIAGATLPIVTALVEKSMLQTLQNGRFRMHELQRQFADERLTANSASAATALRNHAAYYLDFVHQQTRRLLSSEQRQALYALDQEIHNIRAAWQRAVAQRATREIDKAIDGLFDYYRTRSYFQEGCDSFALAASQFRAGVESGDALLVSRLTARQAHFYCHMGRAADAEALLPMLSLGAGSKEDEAFVLCLRATVTDTLHKDWTQSKPSLQQSLELYQELGDQYGQATLLLQLGRLYNQYGGTEEALKYLTDALTISRGLGQPTLIADILMWVGFNRNSVGAYSLSEKCWQEALAIYQELGNDSGIGRATHNLGWAHWCAGEAHFSDAVHCYEQAVAKYQQCGAQVEYGSVLGDLSIVLLALGDKDRAMQCAREGLRIIEATGNIHMLMYSLRTMGAAACAFSDFANARKYLIRSLAIAHEHNLLNNVGRALIFIANVLVAESQTITDVALQQAKRKLARQLYRSAMSDPATWQVYKDRAKPIYESIMDGEEAAEGKPVEEWAIQILTNDVLC